MEHYRSRFSDKRRRRNIKLLYLVLMLAVFFAARFFLQGSKPATVLGDAERFSVTIPSIQADNFADFAELPIEQPLSEPNLNQTHDVTSKSKPELTAFVDEIINSPNKKPSQIIDERNRLNKMLLTSTSEEQLAFTKEQLSKLSEQWLFSRTVFPEDQLCDSYKVAPGDRLATLGKQLKVPYEILMRTNNINNPRELRAGETIKVINGPFHCKIYRSTFTMDLYIQDTFVRSFSVSLGKPGMETPTGRWMVKPGGKLISTIWTNPATGKIYQAEDPDYPLGSRWIGLNGIDGDARDRTGFAIHGMKNSGEIGKANSRGCIRLGNDDAVLIYALLMPGESEVIVVD